MIHEEGVGENVILKHTIWLFSDPFYGAALVRLLSKVQTGVQRAVYYITVLRHSSTSRSLGAPHS